ncbi:MAG: extracellular solute-binding protein [Phycisphaerales bacterium]|nr:extracellular solute-binding protein [Phycisphaerales bacterium]
MKTTRHLTVMAAILSFWGCEKRPSDAQNAENARPTRVVLYTSVDQPFAEEIIKNFQRATGIEVAPVFDSEAGKTTGLLGRLRREAAAPRCDVWWSSEIFGTIELARAGVLAAYDSPPAADIPSQWRDSERRWTAFGARARVLAFRADGLARDKAPTSWDQLAAPEWAGRLAIANPQFGTTRGHVAAMFAYWGDERATAFLEALRVNGALIADGNAQCVRLVDGEAALIGATDTDDVWMSQANGRPIDLVYPALTEEIRVMWIPCSVGLVSGAPNAGAARRLIDYLASAEVERALARSDSRNVPVRQGLRVEMGLEGPAPTPLDFDKVVDHLPRAMAAARDILLR